jgi:hypothetical protein
MTFRTYLVSGLAASVILASQAVGQTAEFQGGGFLTNFSDACAADGWTGTVQVLARMRPGTDQAGAAGETSLNLFVNTYAMHFRFPPEPFTSGGFSTASAFGAIGGSFVTGPATMPRLRALPTPEGTVTSAANEAHVVFEVQDFSNTAGCSFQGNLWLHRR